MYCLIIKFGKITIQMDQKAIKTLVRFKLAFLRLIEASQLQIGNNPGTAQVGAISRLKKSKRTSKCQVFSSTVPV